MPFESRYGYKRLPGFGGRAFGRSLVAKVGIPVTEGTLIGCQLGRSYASIFHESQSLLTGPVRMFRCQMTRQTLLRPEVNATLLAPEDGTVNCQFMIEPGIAVSEHGSIAALIRKGAHICFQISVYVDPVPMCISESATILFHGWLAITEKTYFHVFSFSNLCTIQHIGHSNGSPSGLRAASVGMRRLALELNEVDAVPKDMLS